MAILIFSILVLSLVLYLLLGRLFSNLPEDLRYYNSGNRSAAEGNYQKAKLAYQKAIKLNPDSILSYYELGNLMFREGDYEETLKNFNRVKELAPDEPSIYLRLSEVYKVQGMNGKAEECLARYEELRLSNLQNPQDIE